MSWKIHKTAGQCGGCQRALSDGEAHFSLLRLEGENLLREDRCLACWQGFAAPADAIFWKTTHFVSPQKKKQIDFEALREIFLQLCEKKEPARAALHYLVTLLLVRKKILKIRELKRSEGQDSMIVGFSRSKESFEIPVPDFDPAKLEELKNELKALFGEMEGDGGDAKESEKEAATTTGF